MYAGDDSVAVGPHLYSMVCNIVRGHPFDSGPRYLKSGLFSCSYFFQVLPLTPSPHRRHIIGESHAMSLHLRTSALCVRVRLSFLEFLTSTGLNGSGYVQGRVEDNVGLIAVGTHLDSIGPPTANDAVTPVRLGDAINLICPTRTDDYEKKAEPGVA
jgi:hypothetical protein